MNQLNFFETNIAVGTVDWAMLAELNGYDSTDPDELLYYMLRVLMSFVMALITAYVFISLLDSLPFIGTGIAAAGDEKSFGVNAISSLKPPGEDAMASVQNKLVAQFNEANPGKLGRDTAPPVGDRR